MSILEHPLVQKAAKFARFKHEHQKRLDGKTPYFVHVESVARFVAEVMPDDHEMVAAGYLHDTIEDTGVSFSKIADRFNPEVARMVAALSHDNRLPDDEALREARERIGAGGAKVWIIKLGDILHNAMSLGDAVARAKPDFEARMIDRWTGTLAAIKAAYDAQPLGGCGSPAGTAFVTLYERATKLVAERARELYERGLAGQK